MKYPPCRKPIRLDVLTFVRFLKVNLPDQEKTRSEFKKTLKDARLTAKNTIFPRQISMPKFEQCGMANEKNCSRYKYHCFQRAGWRAGIDFGTKSSKFPICACARPKCNKNWIRRSHAYLICFSRNYFDIQPQIKRPSPWHHAGNDSDSNLSSNTAGPNWPGVFPSAAFITSRASNPA